MDTVSCGRHALALALAGILFNPAHADDRTAHVVVGHGQALDYSPGEIIHLADDRPVGVYLYPRATFDADSLSIVHEGKPGYGYGVLAHDDAELTLSRSRIELRGPSTVGILALNGAVVDLRETALWLAPEAGDYATALSLVGANATLRGSSIDAARGHAISSHFTGTETSRVFLENTTVRGRIGSGTTGLAIASVGSHIEGDIVRDGSGALDLRMLGGAWRGRAGSLSSVSFEDGTWTVTADSDVSALHLGHGGGIAFDRARKGFTTLRADSWEADAGAAGIEFGTRLDKGGALVWQASDRLLIAGDAGGQTPIRVTQVGGVGASTAGRTGVNGPGDGISLIQVGGNASADAFQLAGGYVAVGPWQYRLTAYRPDESDPKQRLLDGSGAGFWDFRLQSTRADTGNAKGEPRAAVLPQVPVYLVLAHALFGYGMASADARHPADGDAQREPALRMRTFGGGMAYRSNLPFGAYGFDYRRRDRGVQVMGDFLAYSVDDLTLRAGVAVSVGRMYLAPRAADGESEALTVARGAGMYAALTTESGWRVTSSHAATHYRTDVRTPARGEVLSRLRANASETTLSLAHRWQPMANLLVEPGVSAAWQRIRFGRVTDRDGVDVQAGAPERGTVRAGARSSLSFVPKGNVLYAWSPYMDLRYAFVRGTHAAVSLSGERMATGHATRAIELSTGARFHLWTRLTAYTEVTSHMRVGASGESGLSARMGVALTF